MGDRRKSGWVVVEKIDNGSTPYVGNEIWRVHHNSNPPERIDEYSIQIGSDYVQVVGLTDSNMAVLIVEDRIANGPSLQIVAGGIKKGQTSEDAAHGEFRDESGWKARELIYLGSHVPQTDIIVSGTEGNDGAKRCHMYLALGLSPSHQKLESTEKIKPILIPWKVAVNAAITGSIVAEAGLPIDDCGSRLILLLADRLLEKEKTH